MGLRFWAPALRSPGIQSPQPLYLLSSLAPVQTGARERSPRPKSVLVAVPVARGSGGAPEGEGPQGRPARRIPGGPPSDPLPVMRLAMRASDNRPVHQTLRRSLAPLALRVYISSYVQALRFAPGTSPVSGPSRGRLRAGAIPPGSARRQCRPPFALARSPRARQGNSRPPAPKEAANSEEGLWLRPQSSPLKGRPRSVRVL